MSPADDQLRELVRRFATLDMTGWDDAAFDRALTHLDWRPPQPSAEEPRRELKYPRMWNYEDYRQGCHGESHEEYDTGLGTGLGEVARHGSETGSEISVPVGEGTDLFLRLRSALEDTLGPPMITRGPGPLLRWHHPAQLLELEHASGYTSLRVVPTEAVEKDEYTSAKWAEPEHGLEQLGYWQVAGPGADWTPGGYWADDWSQFEERLATTLRSVVQDFALLDGPGHFTVVVRTPENYRFVQWTTLADWTLQIQARVPDDLGHAWSEPMAELGWRPSDPSDIEGMVVRDFRVLGPQEATTAARMLVGALQAYGVAYEDLWYELISPNVDLFGIGLPNRHGGRI
ncbi:TY-Chap domain-containing protein [Actinomadura sp. 9N407]|uniref:TY-Chap domain-containing protein n=1 Tax=Actinomadura sp. 9N407 TaxID=3375154 RepID=UPI0037A768F1